MHRVQQEHDNYMHSENFTCIVHVCTREFRTLHNFTRGTSLPQQNGQGQAAQSGEIPGQAAKQCVNTLRKDGRERLGRSSRKIGEHNR